MMFRLRFIGFLLLVTTTTIGCGVLFNFNRVMRLDPVILTQEDLPTMRLMENRRLDRFPEKSSILVGCEQRWIQKQLQFARDVARKIEAKITAVLPQK